jgi:hypothetical protein
VTRYLLAAEADKIQDFIFHSSRLREVVGGSQLLTRFCEDVPSYLLQQCGGDPERDIIIKDGGGLRVLFDYKEAAESFGERLAEVYRRATGSSLTLAEPVEVKGCFEQASKEAEKKLQQAKLWQKNWQSQEQLPHMALCASCGTGLAVSHRAYYQNEEKQYFCVYCLNKGAEQKKGLFSGHRSSLDHPGYAWLSGNRWSDRGLSPPQHPGAARPYPEAFPAALTRHNPSKIRLSP